MKAKVLAISIDFGTGAHSHMQTLGNETNNRKRPVEMHSEGASYLAPVLAHTRAHTHTHRYWVTNKTINWQSLGECMLTSAIFLE